MDKCNIACRHACGVLRFLPGSQSVSGSCLSASRQQRWWEIDGRLMADWCWFETALTTYEMKFNFWCGIRSSHQTNRYVVSFCDGLESDGPKNRTFRSKILLTAIYYMYIHTYVQSLTIKLGGYISDRTQTREITSDVAANLVKVIFLAQRPTNYTPYGT